MSVKLFRDLHKVLVEKKQRHNLTNFFFAAIEILKANRTPGEIPADSDSDEFELEKGVEYMEVKVL